MTSISRSESTTPGMSIAVQKQHSIVSFASGKSSGSGGPSQLLVKLRAGKGLSSESRGEQILKILDNPQKMAILKDIAKKQHVLHYITFYEKQCALDDIISNSLTEMSLGLIKTRVNRLFRDFILTSSSNKLSISPANREHALKNLENFNNSTMENLVDVEFLTPILEDVLEIISRGCLSKFQQRKIPTPVAGTSSNGIPTKASTDDKAVEALKAVLDNETEAVKLTDVLAKQHCLENIFYFDKTKEVLEYSKAATSPIQMQTLKNMIKLLGKEFISNESTYELNIPSKLRKDFEETAKDFSKITVAILEPINKEVLNMILRNSYPLYLKGKE